MKTYPLKCSIRDAGGVTRVDVYDDIGADLFGGGVSAADFAAQLAAVKGALEVHINSAGGDVFDGIAIGQAIRGHKGPVTTMVDGIAASIASVIAQAGRRRVIADGGMVMIHDAFGGCVGNAAEMAQMAATLDKVSGNIAAVYAQRAGGTAEDWRTAMRAETWYTADEAVAAGLADEVAGRAELPAGLDALTLAASAPERIAARLRAASAPVHAPFTGTHSHPHPGPGGAEHDHEHEHSGEAMHGSHDHDPDNDGDDDSTPEGDTDHDYWTADGKPIKPLTGLSEERIRAIVREELGILAADVDNSPWDASKAWHGGAAADDPAAFYRSICAGKKAGDPSKQSSWALPYRYTPSSPPNAAGVRAALGRLDQTQGLTNKAEARSRLQALMKQINPDYEPEDHADTGFDVDPVMLLKALKEGFK